MSIAKDYQVSTIIQPLLFFHSIISQEVIKKVEGKWYSEAWEHDAISPEGKIFFQDDSGIEHWVGFGDELSSLVWQQSKISIEKIQMGVAQLNFESKSSRQYLITIQEGINELIRKAEELSNEFQLLFENALLEVSNYLSKSLNDGNSKSGINSVSDVEVKHKVWKGFGGKDLTLENHRQFYTSALELEIFDETEVSREQFEALSVGSIQNPKIRFYCDTWKAVLFLTTLKNHYKLLSGKNIGDSKIFKTKGGDLLTQTNFDKTNSQNKKRIASGDADYKKMEREIKEALAL